jgi:hypothetical protein
MVHRFLLWGISSALSTLGYLIFLSFALRGSAPTPAAQGIMGLIGVITASSMWIAFFPPAAYARWSDVQPSASRND